MATWKDYTPFLNKDFNTLWELARMIVDQYKRDYPTDNTPTDELIRTHGLPYLVRWIFTTDGAHYLVDFTKPEWNEFIKAFVIRFLNMETGYMDARIWRMRIMRIILEYQNYIETSAGVLFSEILEGDGNVTSTRKSKSTGSETGNSTENGSESTTGSNTDTDNGSTTRNGTSSSNTSSSNKSEGTTSGENNGTTTNDSKTTDNGKNTTRQLTSDMPQSIVNASTVGNPDLQTWTYASGMADTFTKNDNTNVNASSTTHADTDSSTTKSEGSATGESSGTTTDEESHKNTRESSSTGSRTNERTGSNTVNRNSEDEETSVNGTLSTYGLSREKYDFFAQHMKKPIYTVLDKCYKCFISEYPEEYRYGFLTWKDTNNLTSVLYEE